MLRTERDCAQCISWDHPLGVSMSGERCDCRCHLAPNGAKRATFNAYQARYKRWQRAGSPGRFRDWSGE